MRQEQELSLDEKTCLPRSDKRNGMESAGREKSILLHICCAPCATSVVEMLRNEEYNIWGYFYNPNIYPPDEYEHRLTELKQLANEINLSLLIGPCDRENWSTQVNGLEAEPEGGKRCKICYKIRLSKTARMAQEKGFNAFVSTLTVSPHKPTYTINKIGQEIGERHGIKFLARNFKKNDGFKKSISLSQKYELYRQSYCGCEFSLKVKT